MIRFVIPAYNERENIPNLLADLGPVARELGARVIFVDDGSTDGTAEAIEAHSDSVHLAIVRHKVNRGLGTAINSGLRAALGESQDGDAIVTLGGRQHLGPERPAAHARALPRGRRRGARLGLRARRAHPRRRALAPGGLQIGLQRLSLHGRLARDPHAVLALPGLPRRAPCAAPPKHTAICSCASPGFAANVELLLKLYNAGASVAEVPTVNDWSRRLGTSKMNLRPTILAYGRLMAAHLVGRIQPPPISPLGSEHVAAAERPAAQLHAIAGER